MQLPLRRRGHHLLTADGYDTDADDLMGALNALAPTLTAEQEALVQAGAVEPWKFVEGIEDPDKEEG